MMVAPDMAITEQSHSQCERGRGGGGGGGRGGRNILGIRLIILQWRQTAHGH